MTWNIHLIFKSCVNHTEAKVNRKWKPIENAANWIFCPLPNLTVFIVPEDDRVGQVLWKGHGRSVIDVVIPAGRCKQLNWTAWRKYVLPSELCDAVLCMCTCCTFPGVRALICIDWPREVLLNLALCAGSVFKSIPITRSANRVNWPNYWLYIWQLTDWRDGRREN